MKTNNIFMPYPHHTEDDYHGICPSCLFEPLRQRDKYCPLCRVSLAPKQWSTDIITQPRVKLPINWADSKTVTVRINRGKGNLQSFTGTVIAETTTHYKVSWIGNDKLPTPGESFAKQGGCVSCELS